MQLNLSEEWAIDLEGNKVKPFIIKFKNPIDSGILSFLSAKGVTFIQYYYQWSYLILATQNGINELYSMSNIEFIKQYSLEYKTNEEGLKLLNENKKEAWSQNALTNDCKYNADANLLAKDAVEFGNANIGSHSFTDGLGDGNRYNAQSQAWDARVRDANPSTSYNDQYLVIFSAYHPNCFRFSNLKHKFSNS